MASHRWCAAEDRPPYHPPAHCCPCLPPYLSRPIPFPSLPFSQSLSHHPQLFTPSLPLTLPLQSHPFTLPLPFPLPDTVSHSHLQSAFSSLTIPVHLTSRPMSLPLQTLTQHHLPLFSILCPSPPRTVRLVVPGASSLSLSLSCHPQGLPRPPFLILPPTHSHLPLPIP